MKDRIKQQEVDEQIKKALLLIKYDSSKTLTENEELSKTVNEDGIAPAMFAAAGKWPAAAGVGSTVAAGVGSTAAAGVGSTAAAGAGSTAAAFGVKSAAIAIGTKLGATGAAALGVGGAVLGGAVALAVVPLVYWYLRKDTGEASNVKALFEMCSTEPRINKLPRKLNDNQIRDISDKIWEALNHRTWGFLAGTDEEKLFKAFQTVSEGTASDVCELYNYYTRKRGELYEDLDSDIDSPDEWKQIYRPLRNCVEDSLRDLEEKNPCKEGEMLDPKTNKCVPITIPPPKPGKGTYKNCPDFPFVEFCKNDKIREIQNCIGAKVDGSYGPETEGKLIEKGYSTTITKEVFNKIIADCKKTQELKPDYETGDPEYEPTYYDVINN
jgi:hypothetical protein